MNDQETADHIRKWVAESRDSLHSVFAWPTDASGYDQHIRFVEHRNKNWQGGSPEAFRQFALNYANALAPKGEACE